MANLVLGNLCRCISSRCRKIEEAFFTPRVDILRYTVLSTRFIAYIRKNWGLYHKLWDTIFHLFFLFPRIWSPYFVFKIKFLEFFFLFFSENPLKGAEARGRPNRNQGTTTMPSMRGVEKYMSNAAQMYSVYKTLGGTSDMKEYSMRLKAFYLHTLWSHTGGYTPQDCGLPPETKTDSEGFHFYTSREEAEDALKHELDIDDDELGRIFESVDSVHCYS